MTDPIQTIGDALNVSGTGEGPREALRRVEAVVKAARMVDESNGEYRWLRVLHARLAALDPTEAPR